MLRKKFIKHEALLHYLTRLSFYLVMMFIIILQKSTGLVDFPPVYMLLRGNPIYSCFRSEAHTIVALPYWNLTMQIGLSDFL